MLCMGETRGDRSDGVAGGVVAEFHALPVPWVSGPQRLPLGGLARLLLFLANRYSREFETG